MKRDEYLARALSRSRPWELLGISRRTWERRGKPPPELVSSTPPPAVASPPVVTQVPLPLIESPRGPGRCAQCSDLRDGTETEFIIHGARVLLHKECVPYYTALHDRFHVSRWNRP
jgi:hypothetical protein